jgi:hypothetical protein
MTSTAAVAISNQPFGSLVPREANASRQSRPAYHPTQRTSPPKPAAPTVPLPREGDTHNRLGRLSGSKSMCSAKRPADGNLAASA